MKRPCRKLFDTQGNDYFLTGSSRTRPSNSPKGEDRANPRQFAVTYYSCIRENEQRKKHINT